MARGTKNPALLEQTSPGKVECPGHVYVVNRRPLTYNGLLLPVGTEVPDAASWPRVDAWVNARAIRLTGHDEEYTPYADFVAAIAAANESEEPSPGEE